MFLDLLIARSGCCGMCIGFDDLPLKRCAEVQENKMLSKKKQWQPYSAKCTVCKSSLPQDYKYCQKCA